MQNKRGRQAWTLVLIFAAMVFGMVLAGGTNLTPVSMAAAEPGVMQAVAVEAPSMNHGLPSLADLAEAVSPAVVSIRATTIESGRSSRRGTDPFEFFFRRPPGGEQDEPQERRTDSTGSGFVISADGLIITNHHVIDGATGLTVVLRGREYPAEIKGDDPATDLALLKIEPDAPLVHLNLGDSDKLRVGDWIMVIGSPLRLENSVSVGVVSAKGRSIDITPDRSLENFIQTDAAINFGNSGGPLVDLEGSVIGIATAINFGAENIGFAVPVETLKRILPQLRETGSVRRGYLGIQIKDLTYEEAQAFGVKSTDGVLVVEVVADGPSDDALRHGDVILSVDGRQLQGDRELIDYVSSLPPGERVTLELIRGQERETVKVELGERPGTEVAPAVREEAEGSSIEWLGLQYRDLNATIRNNHGIPEDVDGVWVSAVAPTSPLYERGVAPGDVIVEVNGQAVSSVSGFEETITALPSGGYARLYIKRYRGGADASFFAVVRVP